MHGFYGIILKIDMNEQIYSVEAVSDGIVERYLGGKGLLFTCCTKTAPRG